MTTTLPINKVDFKDKLREITDVGSISIFSDTFDLFSSSDKKFKGQVDLEGFKIEIRRSFTDNSNYAIAKGTFVESNGILTIETVIFGFNDFTIIYGLSISLFLFFSLFSSSEKSGNISIPNILFLEAFICAILYFTMKRSAKRLKQELEEEFHNLVNK